MSQPLLPIVCSATVVNGSDTITVTGIDASTGIASVLNDLNCRPNANVLLAGLGYLVKARLTTTTLQLERLYEGADGSVSCTISPFTPEMASRTALGLLLQDYSARAALIAANQAGLSYVYSSAITGAPADGQLAFDATDLSTAALIRLNNTDASGQAIADRLDRWAVGDEITVRATDGSARATFVVSSDTVDETGYRQAAIAYSGADGVLAAGADVVVERLAKGETGGVVGTPMGAYSAGTTYSQGQYVTDQMSSWVYINATPGAGHAPPTLPAVANSYWQLLTAQGEIGPAGLIGNWRGPWVTGTAYAVNDGVQQGGSSYICVTAHTSGTFATDLSAGKWQLVVAKGDAGGVIVQVIPNADFNKAVIAGFYSGSGSEALNAPPNNGEYCTLLVMTRSGGSIQQRSQFAGWVYVRQSTDSGATWTAWTLPGLFSAIASPADVQAGTDNTKGMTPLRTLQEMNAFGFGAAAATMPAAVTNANTLLTSGFYAVGGTWTGSPVAGTAGANQGYLRVQPWATDATYCMQEFTDLSGATRRRTLLAGTWGPWVSDSIVTPWVAYTPTFTGFGTVSNIAVFSRRIGDTLHVRGKITQGTPSGVELRMTLGYAGVNGGLTSDATKVPSIQMAGDGIISDSGSAQIVLLIESGVGYFTFGQQASAASGLTKVTAVAAAGKDFSFRGETPISGW